MSASASRALKLRAHEIVRTSQDPIAVTAAVQQALKEQFGDDIEAVREIAAALMAGTLKDLRRTSYDLPEESGQPALFDIPQVIVVSTPDGDLAVPKAQAETGHVRQWQREGQQHHSVQLSRFKRFGKDLEAISEHGDTAPWASVALPALAEAKRKELEAPE